MTARTAPNAPAHCPRAPHASLSFSHRADNAPTATITAHETASTLRVQTIAHTHAMLRAILVAACSAAACCPSERRPPSRPAHHPRSATRPLEIASGDGIVSRSADPIAAGVFADRALTAYGARLNPTSSTYARWLPQLASRFDEFENARVDLLSADRAQLLVLVRTRSLDRVGKQRYHLVEIYHSQRRPARLVTDPGGLSDDGAGEVRVARGALRHALVECGEVASVAPMKVKHPSGWRGTTLTRMRRRRG